MGLVGDAWHPDRLVNDDKVTVGKNDRTLGEWIGTKLGNPFVDDNHRARRHAMPRQAALGLPR